MSDKISRFRSRIAQSRDDIGATQELRHRVFFGGDKQASHDIDRFDDICDHVLIEDTTSGKLAGCFRFLAFESGASISQSYSAQFYDLSVLAGFEVPMVEMGRFCIDPDFDDVQVVRTAWAAMTRHVDDTKVEMLFGCSSFSGIDPTPYADAFGVLKHKYLAPKERHIGKKSADRFDFTREITRTPNLRDAMNVMPPLLRSYLAMGGWVSDHAVIDRELNTLHVFTGLEIEAIPASRKKLLRALVR